MAPPGKPRLAGHYTSLQGLIGIVQAERLWATNIKFLNDEQEFQHALALLKDLIKKATPPPKGRTLDAYKAFVDGVLKQIDSLDTYRADAVFTLSFSSEIDLLSQWRGYCPNSNGYCLVYDIDGVLTAVRAAFEEAQLVSCVYDASKKNATLKEILNRYWSQYLETDSRDARSKLLDAFASEAQLLASHFKHATFDEERELRLVVPHGEFTDDLVKFRAGKFSLVPYLELPAPKRHLKQIVIGPTVNRDLARRSLETFLEARFGYPMAMSNDVEVVHSQTPYKGW